MNLRLRRIAAACMIAAAGFAGTTAHAKPDAGHPAVARALAQLHQQTGVAAARAGEHEFQFRDLVLDADGTEHVRFARRYHGLRVIGGDLVVHSSATGVLQHISQTLKQAPQLDLSASVLAGSAVATAMAATDGQVRPSGDAERVVYARGGQTRLAWDVLVVGTKASGQPTREHLIVDAHDGQLLARWDDIQTADAVGTAVSHYAGTVQIHTDKQADGTYALRDLTRGGHEVYDLKGKKGFSDFSLKGDLVVDADNQWGDGEFTLTSSSDAVDVAYGQSKAWDFYQALGRNGIADDGRGSYSRVHSSTAPFGLLYNASWSDACFCMTYSRMLDSKNLVLTSLDIAGHEMTHGVTSHTAGLIYEGESGGLNEGSSDIMGSMIERFAKDPADTPDYLIGELPMPDKPLRSMIQPSTDNLSADCYYPGVGKLDPHYSSGVTNHFFYLLAEGSKPSEGPASPTCKPTDTRVATGDTLVRGIGPKQATRIYYRALTVYMTADSTFADARDATLRAATDLFGAESRQVQRVGEAWAAVNVN